MIRLPQPCPDCGGQMSPALRYESGAVVGTVICWTCGAESEPLYARSRRARNGEPYLLDATCIGCGRDCGRRRDQQPAAVYCSYACLPGPPAPLRRSA